MSSVISSFNYKVEASVIIDNTDYKIPDGTINSIIVDYDYDRKNMPAIYVALRLTTDLYNKMITNAETGIISFRLYKFNTQLQNQSYHHIFKIVLHISYLVIQTIMKLWKNMLDLLVRVILTLILICKVI